MFKFITKHKFISAISFLMIISGVYFGYQGLTKNTSAVQYVLAAVEKGTLITSVSGSGQVSASNQIDISFRSTGSVLSVNVKNGQEVKTGTLIAQLDTSDAQKAIRDAQVSLESSCLALEKIKQPADQLSFLQAENALAQTEQSKQKAKDDLKKAYEDGFNTVSETFLDLPEVMAGLNDMLLSSTIQLNQQNTDQQNIDFYADAAKKYDEAALLYRDDCYQAYGLARTNYDQNFTDYKSTSRYADDSTIANLIDQTYDTSKIIAEAVKSANNLIQFYQDKLTENNKKPNLLSDTHLANLSSYTSKINSHLSGLLSIKRTIQDSQEAITDAEWSITEKTESLAELKAGPDPLDIQSQELSIKQKENALADAQEKLADYYIRAPFEGVMASVDVKKRDVVSSATVLATEITKQRVAEIPLNEVDIAKVKIGQKATLTFDAIENLSITGEVADVDALGTVSQGVVTYQVKIVFDTEDERVKPGMSVSASIITDIKQDALLVPNSAVKSANSTNYVEILASPVSTNQLSANIGSVSSAAIPRQQTIQIGLSSDSMTEVISGLKQGDQVVTRTITAANANTTTQTQSQGQSRTGVGIPGLGGFGR